MVEYSHDADIDRTLAALADPTRRALLTRLARGEARVTDLARPYDLSLNAVSKHLKVLEQAGLVRRRVEGREHRIRLAGEPLTAAAHWIEELRGFWEARLDALEDYLQSEGETPPEGGKED